MNEKCYQATPKGTLLEQLADPLCAKSEREWAAARAIAELTAAPQERDALALDAARYRWLRKNGNRFYNAINYQGNDDALDESVDLEMKGKS